MEEQPKTQTEAVYTKEDLIRAAAISAGIVLILAGFYIFGPYRPGISGCFSCNTHNLSQNITASINSVYINFNGQDKLNCQNSKLLNASNNESKIDLSGCTWAGTTTQGNFSFYMDLKVHNATQVIK